MTKRRPTGSIYLCRADGRHTLTWAALEYEVTERVPQDDGSTRIVERHELGPSCYLHEHPDLSLAFAVAIPAVEQIAARCKELAQDQATAAPAPAPMPAPERALRERHAAAGHEGVTSSWAEGGK